MPQSQELQAIATHTQSSLYEQDFLLWLESTTELLRQQNFNELDLENLIEEMEDMGKSNKSAMRSNLMIVLLHLLKWKYQPDKRSNSWKSSIREHRIRIEEDFEDSPSLKNYSLEIVTKSYQNARKLAADQTGLDLAVFPTESPFSLTQILDPEFLP
jgi:Domain of unknown function DUF29